MKIEIEIDESLIPEGYEVVGFRAPKAGDDFIRKLSSSAFRAPCFILKKKRWRAEEGGGYWCTSNIFNLETGLLDVIKIPDGFSIDDDRLYQFGNYYQTKEEAEQAAVRVKKAYLNE